MNDEELRALVEGAFSDDDAKAMVESAFGGAKQPEPEGFSPEVKTAARRVYDAAAVEGSKLYGKTKAKAGAAVSRKLDDSTDAFLAGLSSGGPGAAKDMFDVNLNGIGYTMAGLTPSGMPRTPNLSSTPSITDYQESGPRGTADDYAAELARRQATEARLSESSPWPFYAGVGAQVLAGMAAMPGAVPGVNLASKAPLAARAAAGARRGGAYGAASSGLSQLFSESFDGKSDGVLEAGKRILGAAAWGGTGGAAAGGAGVAVLHPIAKRLEAKALAKELGRIPDDKAFRSVERQDMAAERKILHTLDDDFRAQAAKRDAVVDENLATFYGKRNDAFNAVGEAAKIGESLEDGIAKLQKTQGGTLEDYRKRLHRDAYDAQWDAELGELKREREALFGSTRDAFHAAAQAGDDAIATAQKMPDPLTKLTPMRQSAARRFEAASVDDVMLQERARRFVEEHNRNLTENGDPVELMDVMQRMRAGWTPESKGKVYDPVAHGAEMEAAQRRVAPVDPKEARTDELTSVYGGRDRLFVVPARAADPLTSGALPLDRAAKMANERVGEIRGIAREGSTIDRTAEMIRRGQTLNPNRAANTTQKMDKVREVVRSMRNDEKMTPDEISRATGIPHHVVLSLLN